MGAALVAPRSGREGFAKPTFYEPIPSRMAGTESLDGWLVWSRHFRAGRPAVSLTQTLLNHFQSTTLEQGFGQINVHRGLSAPMSGCFGNPFASGSSAIGRSLYWGLVFPDDPERAGHFAFYDASIHHGGEGVEAAVALARLTSMAAPGAMLPDLIRVATDILPASSALLGVLPVALESVAKRDGVRQAWLDLQGRDLTSGSMTFLVTLMAILNSDGKIDEALRIAAGCGGASDQATLGTGLIAGLLAGTTNPEWQQPLGDQYVSGFSLRGIDPPTSITNFIATICADALTNTKLEPVVTVGAPAEAPPALPPQPTLTPPKALLEANPMESNFTIGELEVKLGFLASPIIQPGQALQMLLTIRSVSDGRTDIDPQLRAPDGWTVAHKLAPCALDLNQSVSFPIVAKPALTTTGNLRLSLAGIDFLLPIPQADGWSWLGPLANAEGLGFDRVFPVESRPGRTEIFNGRSELPVKWQDFALPPHLLDLEALFAYGPGVVYLAAQITFDRAGRYSLVAEGDTAVRVRIDGTFVLSYYDHHIPTSRPRAPYIAEFETLGTSNFLVKILRDGSPTSPLTFYFLNDEGRVVAPRSVEYLS